MSEISVNDEPPQTPGRPPAPARPPVQEFHSGSSVFRCTQRCYAPDSLIRLRSYGPIRPQSSEQRGITRAKVGHVRPPIPETGLIARKDLNWSITDPRLYNEAFTGRACSIARCTFCLQDDHVAAYCPHNPNRPFFSWFPKLVLQE